MRHFGWGRVKTVLAFAAIAAFGYSLLAGAFGSGAVTSVSAEQDPFLSRRIDQVEQRFYSIESRLNMLEQESRRSTVTPRVITSTDAEIQALRSLVDSLRLRLGEAECGLLRLDERTLTPAARTARARSSATVSDICRQDRDQPIQLTSRP